jgi:hypothetical protein
VLGAFVNGEITVNTSDAVLLVILATCFSLVNKCSLGLDTKYHIGEFNIQ